MQKQATIEQALAFRFPESVALVTAAWKGKQNAMAVGWAMLASDDPWMFALGIDGDACTFGMIKRGKEFVVAFPSETLARETLYMGTHHGHKLDKFKICGLKTNDAAVVSAPLISEAVANFECKLIRIVKPGNCPIVFGRIVAAHINKNSKAKRLYTVGKNHSLSGVRATTKPAETI